MKKIQFLSLLALASLITALLFSGCEKEENDDKFEERVLVANRNAGNISMIDAVTNQVIATINVTGKLKSEPMYVMYANDKIFAGDRANSVVHVYNSSTLSEIKTIPCGNGVFHMWAPPGGKGLWVNNDIDFSITVIDTKKLEVIRTINIGQKPHDIILSSDGKYAFVSIFSGSALTPDSIFKYSTKDYTIKAKTAVAKDPHVSLNTINDNLYVPCQSGKLFILHQSGLQQVKVLDIPGAHGAGMRPDGKIFYTTNLPGGGTKALWAINTKSNEIIVPGVNTATPGPHNIAINPDGSKLFLTHSGATSTTVSVYRISLHNPEPVFETNITTDLNPFGIIYYRKKIHDN